MFRAFSEHFRFQLVRPYSLAEAKQRENDKIKAANVQSKIEMDDLMVRRCRLTPG